MNPNRCPSRAPLLVLGSPEGHAIIPCGTRQMLPFALPIFWCRIQRGIKSNLVSPVHLAFPCTSGSLQKPLPSHLAHVRLTGAISLVSLHAMYKTQTHTKKKHEGTQLSVSSSGLYARLPAGVGGGGSSASGCAVHGSRRLPGRCLLHVLTLGGLTCPEDLPFFQVSPLNGRSMDQIKNQMVERSLR